MRIHLWPERDGRREAMVVPDRRAHLPPIRIGSHSREDLLAELVLVAEHVRLAETPQLPLPFPG